MSSIVLRKGFLAPHHHVRVNCLGSRACDHNKVNWLDCWKAKHKIDPNHRYIRNYGKDSHKSGVCEGTCSLRVVGDLSWKTKDRCDLSGREMIAAFDEIRDHGCRICGTK
ncbi:hypothetical protein VTO42DRAFT_1784 [Malbranchea cinnamomea]